jgi:hypothetical protein
MCFGRLWAASDADDFEAAHQIYGEDAVLEYPQSGERIRRPPKIQSSRAVQPSRERFTAQRITGVATFGSPDMSQVDGRPSYTVSLVGFIAAGKVARPTRSFGDPFAPGASRAQSVEQMP